MYADSLPGDCPDRNLVGQVPCLSISGTDSCCHVGNRLVPIFGIIPLGSFDSWEHGGAQPLGKYEDYVCGGVSARAYLPDLLLLNTCQNQLKSAVILIWMCIVPRALA